MSGSLLIYTSLGVDVGTARSETSSLQVVKWSCMDGYALR
jgi:hypothetical protein